MQPTFPRSSTWIRFVVRRRGKEKEPRSSLSPALSKDEDEVERAVRVDSAVRSGVALLVLGTGGLASWSLLSDGKWSEKREKLGRERSLRGVDPNDLVDSRRSFLLGGDGGSISCRGSWGPGGARVEFQIWTRP